MVPSVIGVSRFLAHCVFHANQAFPVIKSVDGLAPGRVFLDVAVSGKIKIVGDASGLSRNGLLLHAAKGIIDVGHGRDVARIPEGQKTVICVVSLKPDLSLRVSNGGEVICAVSVRDAPPGGIGNGREQAPGVSEVQARSRRPHS